MSDIEDILSEDSVSQHSQPQLFSISLSSHIPSSVNGLTVPPGIKVINRCIVVTECLNKLVDHFKKVSFPKTIY